MKAKIQKVAPTHTEPKSQEEPLEKEQIIEIVDNTPAALIDDKPEEYLSTNVDSLPPKTINWEPLITEESTESSVSSGKPKLIIVVVVFLIVAVIGVLAYLIISSSKTPLPGSNPKTAPAVTTPIVTTPTPSATESAVTKSDMKIQVLNASGITGLAGKIKTNLTSLGYTNILTGNATDSGVVATDVIFSDKVPQTFKEEIVTELQKTFTVVGTHQSSPLNIFDVSITVGKGIK